MYYEIKILINCWGGLITGYYIDYYSNMLGWILFYNDSSLKQHVYPLWHIILSLSQPVFALNMSTSTMKQQTPVLLVFGLIQPDWTHDILHSTWASHQLLHCRGSWSKNWTLVRWWSLYIIITARFCRNNPKSSKNEWSITGFQCHF